MAVWTIEVINDSGATKDYAVFNAPPEVRFDGDLIQVHPCAWLVYDGVGPDERRRSTFSESIDLCVDLNGGILAPGVVVQNNASVPVDPRARDRVSILSGNSGQIFGPVEHDRSAYGTVSVETPAPGSFPDPKVSLVEIGKFGDSDLPVPTAAFPARPNGVFEIKPSTRFHMIEGRYLRGEALGLFPPPGAVIDFAGRGDVKATVVQSADGVFTVSYGPN
jgi:hypothetical protein